VFNGASSAGEATVAAADEASSQSRLEDHPQVVEAVERFDDAWERGERPLIEAYLGLAEPLRQAVLVALVQVDLERRIAAEEDVRIERYLERFPELAGDPAIAVKLIAVEYRLRRGQAGVHARRLPAAVPTISRSAGWLA
jgi:hypothetical protein